MHNANVSLLIIYDLLRAVPCADDLTQRIFQLRKRFSRRV
jgi:hypothetical protein